MNMTGLGIIIIGFIVGYILSVLLARGLGYIVYMKLNDDFGISTEWFIPIINVFYSIICIGKILSYYTPSWLENIFDYISGENWEEKKARREKISAKKYYEKHKEVDPYGEENWEE